MSRAVIIGLISSLSCLAFDTFGQGVQITENPDRLRIEINGKLFTEYFFKDVPRPYCYPLMGPGDTAMTRNWPMKSVPDEEHDHPHHRSLWFSHGSVNGNDFWSETKSAGKIIHEGFIEIKSGKESGFAECRSGHHYDPGRKVGLQRQRSAILISIFE